MSDGDVQEPQQVDGEPRRRSRWFAIITVAAVACVILIGLLVPVVATSSSSYCGSCHSMKQAYRSWQRGAHSSVPCAECHVPPGAVAGFKWRSKEARNIWLEYLNMQPPKDRQAPPATENCVECHPLKGLMGIPGKIRMPHATHINQNNLECIDCHDHTAHAAPGQSSAVSMAPCTMCHEQTSDPAGCDFCHYTPPEGGDVPPDGLPPGARQAGTGQRAGLRPLSPQQGAVLRRLSREAHARPLLGELAVCARPAGQEGPHPVSRLPHGRAALQPVSHGGSPRRLGDVARARGGQGGPVVPRVSPGADVRGVPPR